MCDYCSWIDQILAKVQAEVKKDSKKRPKRVDPVIVVHGGAGRIPRKERKYMLNEVKNAAILAYNELINGCSAVDAVENAISHLESKAYFNCAKGGSLDVNDDIVTDAAIVSLDQAGCVGAVRDVEHPITLARKVMENTEHVLIVENGAQKLARETGVPILLPGYLNIDQEFATADGSIETFVIDGANDADKKVCVRSKSENSLNDVKECIPECTGEQFPEDDGEEYPYDALSFESKESTSSEPMILQAGAVGAVAYDRKKRLVAGTSTAGKPGKPVGSVSAIGTVIGCGVYANENGCVSVSGDDTRIYCCAPAREIIQKLERDMGIECALNLELEYFVKTTGESCVGAVALNGEGEPSVSFRSMHFPWAFCRKGYVYYGCAKDERFCEEVKILERPLDCMCAVSDDTLN